MNNETLNKLNKVDKEIRDFAAACISLSSAMKDAQKAYFNINKLGYKQAAESYDHLQDKAIDFTNEVKYLADLFLKRSITNELHGI
jgi:translation elongation factor EF-G